MQIDFTFPLKAGLHARPAARLQEETQRFLSSITMRNRSNGACVNAKSTLALVSTLTRPGDACSLVVEGEDETRACVALKDFIAQVLPHCDDDLLPPGPPASGSEPLPRLLRGSTPLRGIPVSPGIATGRSRIFHGADIFARVPAAAEGPWEEEEAKFVRAVAKVSEDIERTLGARSRRPEKGILQAHLSILRDTELHDRIVTTLQSGHVSAAAAVREAAQHYGELLSGSQSEYLRERAEDIRDVAERVVSAIYGPAAAPPRTELDEDAVCVAENLSPSEFLGLGTLHLRAVILVHGGTTSHTVILARAQGIPCVAGVHDATEKIASGEEVVVDADRGLIFLRPEGEVHRFYSIEIARQEKIAQRARSLVHEAACTAEGNPVGLAANASSLEDVRVAMRNGAEGIGVFRTEMLFLDRETPATEDEQSAFYTKIVSEAGGKPVILRTLDIGGDKPIPAIPLPEEENPFLGFRAIRMYAEHPDIIDAQIRAMLRASATGPVKIMFPMVSTLTEVVRLKERVRRCMDQLRNKGVPFNDHVPIGIMIEVPSLFFQMDRLCAEVDFFSVGTNDLTQYLFAVDRGNERVSDLYNPLHPALLHGLKMIIDGAHRHGRHVAICGEMAGMPTALPVLLGLGFDELSVSPVLVPRVKSDLRTLSAARCSSLTREVLASATPEEVKKLAEAFLRSSRQQELVHADIVDVDARGKTKAEIIRELVALLQFDERLENADEVEEAIWRREETYATGMGSGIALPHCKSSSVRIASVAVAKMAKPVLWNPPEEPVTIAILVAIPGDGSEGSHLNIIAHIARKLVYEEFRQALAEASQPEKIVALLRGTVDES